MNNNACIFCSIVSPVQNNTVSCLEIYDNDYCKVILDISPITRGHLIIISKSHHAMLHQLSRPTYDEMFRVASILTHHLPEVLPDISATNLVVNDGKNSGQHIPHVHIHIIPRKKNDTLLFYWRLLTRFVNPFSRLSAKNDLNRVHKQLMDFKIAFEDHSQV